jgi:hypothetical protein
MLYWSILLTYAACATVAIRTPDRSQHIPVQASSKPQSSSISVSNGPESQNGVQARIGPRSVGVSQIDSITNGQFSKISLGPKVEKLPVAVRMSGEFLKQT